MQKFYIGCNNPNNSLQIESIAISIESLDSCPYTANLDPNDNFFSQMEAKKSTVGGELDSPVSPVVDGSAVTQLDNASGDDGDQTPAVDGVEGR